MRNQKPEPVDFRKLESRNQKLKTRIQNSVIMNDNRNNSLQQGLINCNYRKKLFCCYLFSLLYHNHNLYNEVWEKMISFEQPLAPKITPGSVVRKLGKVVHWVNHYSVRVSDFSVG